MIIESSANQLYQVREANDPNLAHAWLGFRVKLVKGEYVPMAKAREGLVRKAGCRLIQA